MTAQSPFKVVRRVDLGLMRGAESQVAERHHPGEFQAVKTAISGRFTYCGAWMIYCRFSAN